MSRGQCCNHGLTAWSDVHLPKVISLVGQLPVDPVSGVNKLVISDWMIELQAHLI